MNTLAEMTGKSRYAAIVAGYLCTTGYTVEQAINLNNINQPTLRQPTQYLV